MNIRFWGVRGSLPAPLLPSQIREKISAVLEQITPDDITGPEARRKFLEGLPPWLYGTVGSNSPCVSLNAASFDGKIVFDAGSGLREMGIAEARNSGAAANYHIFFSHFHWDHLHGLPFFNPGYSPQVSLEFYSPKENLKDTLQGQMIVPYFPILMETMASKKTFTILDGQDVRLGGLEISYKKMNHPGDSYSYKVREGEKRFIYASDTELTADDFMPSEENALYFKDADIIVLDSQYTLGESIEKYNWGHSAFSLAVDFAATWNVKHLILFHHDPAYGDKKLYEILDSARKYAERMGVKLKIDLALEEMEISL